MKRAAAVLGIAIAGSQAGHLLAYELRFGEAAQQMQSTGAHAYFPMLAKTSLGAAALLLIGSLLLIGFARIATGRRLDSSAAPSLLRLLAALYTLQLGLFITQELIEGSPAGDLLLWGLMGQLPVALAGAVALRWLFQRLGPALAQLRIRYQPALRLAPYIVAQFTWPVAADFVQGFEPGEAVHFRGPPSF